MKSNEKKMLLIIVVIGIVLIGALLIARNSKNKNKGEEQSQQSSDTATEKYVDVLGDGTKLNKSSKLSETKKLNGLEVSNIQLTHRNGMSVLLADVKNTTSVDVGLTEVTITLYDEKGNVLEKLDGLISPVKAGETVQLNCGVSADYANAYDFSIVKK